MNNKVEWKYVKSKISVEDIKEIEQKLCIVFPTDYVVSACENNGGRPKPNIFDTKTESECVFKSLLNLDVNMKGNILDTLKWLENQLPKGIIPFADDPSGNFICFDYRDGNTPSIVFWKHDADSQAISNICETYSQLLDMLYAL